MLALAERDKGKRKDRGEGEGGLRIDDHDLAQLAVGTRCTVQEHRLRACDRHVKGSHLGLAVLERDVSAVHTSVHRRAGLVRG